MRPVRPIDEASIRVVVYRLTPRGIEVNLELETSGRGEADVQV